MLRHKQSLTKMHKQVSALISFAGLAIAFGLAVSCFTSNNSISASFPSFWKENRDFGKFRDVLAIYESSSYYGTGGMGPQVMWADILEKSGCSDVIANQTQMCRCLEKFHTGHFEEIYKREEPENNAQIEVMRTCLFRHRFTTSIKLFEDMGISPFSAIIYILGIGCICEIMPMWYKYTDIISMVAFGTGIFVSTFGPAIWSGVESFVDHKSRPKTQSGFLTILLPTICLFSYISIDLLRVKQWKDFWAQRCYQIEYCLTLLVLVSLYDATQQQRDYFYMVSRILFACGLGLFALWRDPGQAKDTFIVWLVGTLFLVGNTPPAKWTSSVFEADPYWTSGFIPAAFYLYVVGMPLAIYMTPFVDSSPKSKSSAENQAKSSAENQSPQPDSVVCMAVSKGTRLMLFLAVVAAFSTGGKKMMSATSLSDLYSVLT